MAAEAVVTYWFEEQHLPTDGGGLRVRAWLEALRSSGFDTRVDPIFAGPVRTLPPSRLSRVKRLIAPMPLARRHTPPPADLIVSTVPGVFGAFKKKRDGSQTVVFDWMDRWSANALSMRGDSLLTTPGAATQSIVWRRRESVYPRFANANTFAGYEDSLAVAAGEGIWLPTPAQPKLEPDRKSARAVRVVGFIGNLAYEPNERSLRSFLSAYGDRFRDAGISIVVAGLHSEKVRDWGFDVQVLGAVESVDTFYSKIDAAIVPIEHGGGIKVKAVEALMRGVPVIATRHVVAGFDELSARGAIVDLDWFMSRTHVKLIVSNHDYLISRFSQNSFTRSVRSVLSHIGAIGGRI